MNKSSRTISFILSALARLESSSDPTAMDALVLLDEIRRLRRKWDAQVAANSPRRIEQDFREMQGWHRRWLIASRRILAREDVQQLREACEDVETSLA